MRYFIRFLLLIVLFFFVLVPMWNLCGTGENALSTEEGIFAMIEIVVAGTIVFAGWKISDLF